MKIIHEISLENFEAWSGAVSTLEKVVNAGKVDNLESILEEMYPDGMTATELNDLLWFEPETVYEWLGMRTESQIREELEEAEEELENVKEAFEDAFSEEVEEINTNRELQGMNELDEEEIEKLRSHIYKDYQRDIEEAEEKINDLKEELENY